MFSYLGVKSGKAPAAVGGVEGFALVLQTGPALLPLSLQGVSALLLGLLQLVSHLLSQLCCRLVKGKLLFFFLFDKLSASSFCACSRLTCFFSLLCLRELMRCSCFCSFLHSTSFICFTPYRALCTSSSTSFSPYADSSVRVLSFEC